MPSERVRPLATWATGRPALSSGLVAIRLKCEGEEADTYILTRAEAKKLARAILAETRPTRPH